MAKWDTNPEKERPVVASGGFADDVKEKPVVITGGFIDDAKPREKKENASSDKKVTE